MDLIAIRARAAAELALVPGSARGNGDRPSKLTHPASAFRCAASDASRFLAASASRSALSRAMVRSAEPRSFRLCFDDACFDDGCFAAVMTRPFLSNYGRAQARCSGASFLLMAALKWDEYFLPELVPLANSTSMKPGQVLSSRDKLTTNAWRQDGTSFPHTKKCGNWSRRMSRQSRKP